MSVLVMGAAGTLGTLLTRRLGWQGIDARAADPQAVTHAIAMASVVVNLSGPRARPELTAADYVREHVGLATRIVHAMRPGTLLVHVSSTAVFGQRGGRLTAGAPEDPGSFPLPDYAEAKLAAEAYVRAQAPPRKIRVTVLRPSMIYGDGVDSALSTLLRLHRRGVPLALRPPKLRQHLTSASLFLSAVSAAARTESAPDPLIVADPFVLTNADLAPRARIQIPLDVSSFATRPPGRGRLGFWRGVAGVLGVDNEFETAPTFAALRIDPADFGRERSFSPYWGGGPT